MACCLWQSVRYDNFFSVFQGLLGHWESLLFTKWFSCGYRILTTRFPRSYRLIASIFISLEFFVMLLSKNFVISLCGKGYSDCKNQSQNCFEALSIKRVSLDDLIFLLASFLSRAPDVLVFLQSTHWIALVLRLFFVRCFHTVFMTLIF